MDAFWAAPPISRTLAAGVLGTSILVYTGILPFSSVFFHYSLLLKLPPQLWRVATSFLITGPKLGILFDTYFIYTYGSKLEAASPRFSHTGDFFAYIVFICLAILGLTTFVTGGMIYTSALLLAFAWTSAQDDRGQNTMLFVIQIPAHLMPYAILLITLVSAGPSAAMIQATGLVAAHLHDFLTRIWPTFGGGSNLLPTPSFVKRMFETTGPTVNTRGNSTTAASAQRAAPPTSNSSAVEGGVLPASWRNRGSGRRLGGD